MTLMLDSPLPAWAAPAFMGDRPRGHCVQMNLPEHLYHGTHALLSKSAIAKDMGDEGSLEKFQHYMTSTKPPPSDVMIEGSALHTMVLEPELFRMRYKELPDFGPMQSSTNRAKRDHWIAEECAGQGFIALTKMQLYRVQEQAQALRMKGDIRSLLRGAQTEVSIAWTHRGTGLRMKSRADILNANLGIAADLKRARSASPRGFARAIDNMLYHVQDVLYTEGLRQAGFDVKHFVFVACEPEPPYAIGCYQLKPASRIAAEAMIERTMVRIARAIDSGVFPGYTDGVVDVDIPEYSLSKAERMAQEEEDAAEIQTYRPV